MILLKDLLTNDLDLGLELDGLAADSFIRDLGIDSLVLVKLIYLLEDKYQIRLTTSDVLNITTVGELEKLINSRFEERVAATN